MPTIRLLEKETIDLIAAGEVIERPSSVVKELVENAIDAGATAITVEIRDGGMELIRVTDNGCGIEKEQLPLAFYAHATSKIHDASDLDDIMTLGFRGEALSSIAAVARVEVITKTTDALLGARYVMEGGKEMALEDVGAPDGTTFLIRSLFFQTPARRKFLKSAQTEGGYIHTLMQHLALSHPDIAFQLLSHGQTKLYTSGSDSPREIIYRLYGKDIASSLIPVDASNGSVRVKGYIGKPIVTRGNRNFENYYVNGRYVKSNVIEKGIEDAYRTYLMQHQYPFTVLSFTVDACDVDVNVHPQKLELRFYDGEALSRFITESIAESLKETELIPEVKLSSSTTLLDTEDHAQTTSVSVPQGSFEGERVEEETEEKKDHSTFSPPDHTEPFEKHRWTKLQETLREEIRQDTPYEIKYEQQTLPLYSQESRNRYRVLGQAFSTYWIVEMEDKLFLIDQHAAHEKVIFERLMKQKGKKEPLSQQIAPPLLLVLSTTEEETLQNYMGAFSNLGYEIESFGGSEYTITAVPADLYGLNEKQLFVEMLDDLAENGRVADTDQLYMKIATMACKAAIKGNERISEREFCALFDEMLTLENPYHCPHGRPTTIQMSRNELEKKFKRII